jgi:hypothetical protein
MPLKSLLTFIRQHNVTPKKTEAYITTAVRISDPIVLGFTLVTDKLQAP